MYMYNGENEFNDLDNSLAVTYEDVIYYKHGNIFI